MAPQRPIDAEDLALSSVEGTGETGVRLGRMPKQPTSAAVPDSTQQDINFRHPPFRACKR